jgi:chaperonin GroES
MIVPFNKRLLIQRREGATETEGGIIIPEASRQQYNEGVVVATAEDCKLKEGYYVLYGGYVGEEISWDGQSYLLLPEDEVFAYIVDGGE